MENHDQIQIDITVKKVCTTCYTETPFRYLDALTTLGEHSTLEFRVDVDEFLLCQQCGNPMRLRIQAQPYELVNHLDSPVALALYRQLQEQQH